MLAAFVAIGIVGSLSPPADAFMWTSAPGSPYQFNGFPESVAIGDFNGDGLSDMAVATSSTSPSDLEGSGEVSVLLNGGDGFRSAPFDNRLGGGGNSVATADFNGDGKLDLAATDDKGVWILMGNGDGTFAQTAASPISDGHRPGQVVTGDFNGDGKPDLAIVNMDNTVSVLLGNGDGTFRPAPGPPIIVSSAGAIAVGDFNGDGKPDLAILSGPSSPSGTLTVLVGWGDGTFSAAPGSPIALNARASSLAVGDFNGYGKPDIAVAADTDAGSSSSGQVIVLLGRGDGSFTPAPGAPILVPPGGLYGIAAGDFNGDGKPDIASGFRSNSNPPGDGVYLFLGDGTGRFGAARGSPFPVSTPTGLSTGGVGVLASTTTGGRTALIINPGFYSTAAGELYALLAPLPSDPPAAALAASPNPAVRGRSVKLNASASSDPLDRQIIDYRWDLGRGTFGRDTGTNPTIAMRFPARGTRRLRVRVTNSAGETATASAQLVVRRHPPPRRRVRRQRSRRTL